MEEQEQEMLFRLSMFEQQINQLQEQIQAVDKGINELGSLTTGLDGLKDSTGKEIFAPLGRGIFIKSKVISEDLLVDVGGKNLVKKSIPQTQELIESQIIKLQEIKKELDNNLEAASREVEKTINEAKEKQN